MHIEETVGSYQPTKVFLPVDLDVHDERCTNDIHKIIALLGQPEESNEKVHLYISGYGGDVNLMIQLINAIQSSRVLEKVIIHGPVYSAHAILAVCAPVRVEIEIRKHVFLMFHDISSFEYGKLSELAPSIETTKELLKRVLKSIRSKALTQKEQKTLMNGQDHYIFGEDMKKRLGV